MIVVVKSLTLRDIPECIENWQVELIDEVKRLSLAPPDLLREELHLLPDHLLHGGLSKSKISESKLPLLNPGPAFADQNPRNILTSLQPSLHFIRPSG